MQLPRRSAPSAVMIAVLALGACDDFAPKTNSTQPAKTAQADSPSRFARVAPAAPSASAAQSSPSDQSSAPAAQPSAIAAQGSTAPQAKAIDAADLSPDAAGIARRDLLIRAQVILDRAHFSPGAIDGRAGGNFYRALAAFELANGVSSPNQPGTVPLDVAAWKTLIASDGAPVTQDYEITADDVKGPFLGALPDSMAAQAKLRHLGYTTPVQALAEKFHMDQGLLRALNPEADFSVAGTSIVVVRPSADPLPTVARLVVDKSANQVRAYDAANKIVAEFPATVGSTERPAPSGAFSVKSVVSDPDYTYDPSRLTFGDAASGKLTIRPGPNNPVGSTWIDLTIPTYGIHGSPDPTQIGKTASHGCVRMTNWDVAALGKAVRKGTPVLFVGTTSKKA